MRDRIHTLVCLLSRLLDLLGGTEVVIVWAGGDGGGGGRRGRGEGGMRKERRGGWGKGEEE